MKTVVACMSLVVMGLLLIAQSYAQSDESLQVLYLLDEGSGNTAEDSSANGRDGAIEGGAEYVDDGVFGKAISFDGTGTIRVPEVGALDAVTIVTWISSPATVGSGAAIFNDDGWNPGILHFQAWNGDVAFSIHSNSPEDTPGSGIRVEGDVWRHLALVYSVADKWAAIYGEGEIASEVVFATAAPVIIGPGTIGSWDGGRFWTGRFDEFAIFDEALEQEQIQNIMDKGLEKIFAGAVSPADGLATTWGQVKYE